jgi:RNA polymerase sigma-70 factor (sigma-E family)
MTDQVGSTGDRESEVERTLGTLATLNPAYALDHEPPPAEAPPITIDELYRTHRMQMVRMAILLVDDMASAEDVVQEAFAGLYRNWGNLRDRNAAIGYLRTAVVNGSRSMLRRRRTARAYVPPDPGTARSAESLALLSTEHQAVVSALGDLAPRQREVLVLRYYGGLSEAEIAEATGLSKGTVKSTASRAVAKLGDIMRSAHS